VPSGNFFARIALYSRPWLAQLILLFGLHLLGWLAKLTFRVGIILGILFVILGFLSSLQGGPIFGGIRMIHFFSIALIGFFGPAMGQWLNRDIHLRNKDTQPGMGAVFSWFCFRVWLDPCIGPILATVLALAAASPRSHVVSCYSRVFGGIAVPFLLAALALDSSCASISDSGVISMPSKF